MTPPRIPAPRIPAPRILVCEDGTEYLERFARFLGVQFHFERAGDLASLRAALERGPAAGLVLDLDFRRTPGERLVDEQGRSGAPHSEHPRLASMQGILILRALRRGGSLLPALLCADLDDPAREALLVRELAPLQLVPSSESLQQLRERLAGLGD